MRVLPPREILSRPREVRNGRARRTGKPRCNLDGSSGTKDQGSSLLSRSLKHSQGLTDPEIKSSSAVEVQ